MFGLSAAWKKKKKKSKSSCILCHHMHEKGAIKEHISFIPGNFPNPWWAAGEREMLWMWVSRWQRRDFVVAPERARFNAREHELVWIHLHYWEDLFNGSFLSFIFGIPFNTFVFGSMCICVWAWIIGNKAGIRGLCPPGEGVRRAQGLVHPIFS